MMSWLASSRPSVRQGTALIALAVMLIDATAFAQRSRRKPRQPQFHPEIVALFVLPEKMSPSFEQKEELGKLLLKYGPQLQRLTPLLQAERRYRRQRKTVTSAADKVRLAQRGGLRLRTIRKARPPKEVQFEKNLKAAVVESKRLQGEIKKEINGLLTDEQKKEIRERRAKKQKDKKPSTAK